MSLDVLESFDKYVGRANYDQIKKDTDIFGAKGSYIEELERFQKKIKEWLTHDASAPIHPYIDVPPYELVDISYYKERLATGKIDNNLIKALCDRWQDVGSIIVRSSAVFSEDNDKTMAPGIYDSEFLRDISEQKIQETIETVYKSCNSSRAKKYRQENGINDEYMGSVIQQYIKTRYPSPQGYSIEQTGYVNTILKNRPELCEVILTNNHDPDSVVRTVYNRINFTKYAHSTFPFNKEMADAFHFRIDYVNRGFDIDRSSIIMQLALWLERYFDNKPIQIEFAQTTKKIDDTSRDIYHILQVRPLPLDFSVPYHVAFPLDKTSLWEGRALGFMHKELDVLITGEDNNKKIGLVIFGSDLGACRGDPDFVDKSLPAPGGAVLIKYHNGDNGHIETLCAEKGITVFFSIGWEDNKGSLVGSCTEVFYSLKGYKKVLAISDGLEGKIYGISEGN